MDDKGLSEPLNKVSLIKGNTCVFVAAFNCMQNECLPELLHW